MSKSGLKIDISCFFDLIWSYYMYKNQYMPIKTIIGASIVTIALNNQFRFSGLIGLSLSLLIGNQKQIAVGLLQERITIRKNGYLYDISIGESKHW